MDEILEKLKKPLLIAGGVAFTIFLIISWARSGSAPTGKQLANTYPFIDSNSRRPENTRILCPFLRIIERSGMLDAYESMESFKVGLFDLVKAAQTFGCGMIECGGVALKVSQGQQKSIDLDSWVISLEQLHVAQGVAHECGFTFAKGGSVVSDKVRAKSILRLSQKANKLGQVSFQDLLATKKDICQEQKVEMSEPGQVEVKLIFAYLGGVENGYVLVSDIERLFHAKMPTNKTKEWIRFSLFKKLDQKYGSEIEP